LGVIERAFDKPGKASWIVDDQALQPPCPEATDAVRE